MPREFSLQDLDAMVTGESSEGLPEERGPGKQFSLADLDAMVVPVQPVPKGPSKISQIVEGAQNLGKGVEKHLIIDPIVGLGEVASDTWDHFRKRWDERGIANIDASFSADQVATLKAQNFKGADDFPDSGVNFFGMSVNPSEPQVVEEDTFGKWVSPLTLLLRESMPSQMIQSAFRQPELTRARFDAANRVLQQSYIVSHPEEFPQVTRDAAQAAIDTRKARVDPTLWEQTKGMAAGIKEDPGAVGLEFAKGILADPWAVSAALEGTSIKVLTNLAKLGKVAKVPVAIKAADRAIGAGIAGGGVNAAITIAHQENTPNGRDRAEIQFAATLGAALGGPLGLVFGKGAKARETIKGTTRPTGEKVAGDLGEVLDNAIKDLAKTEAVIDDLVEPIIEGKGASRVATRAEGLDEVFDVVSMEQLDDFFGIGKRTNPNTGELEVVTDLTKWHKKRAAELRALFKEEKDYADFLEFKAQERADLTRSRENREAIMNAKRLQEFEAKEARNISERAKFQEEFDNAVEARDLQEQLSIIEQARKLNEDHIRESSLNEADAMQAAWTEDVPVIRNAMQQATRRANKIRQRGVEGFADVDLLVKLGLGAGVITAGLAMFPEDGKKGSLAAILLGAVTRRAPRHFVARDIAPRLLEKGLDNPNVWPIQKMVQRYITRHLGKDTDPLHQVELLTHPGKSIASLMDDVLTVRTVNETDLRLADVRLATASREVELGDMVTDIVTTRENTASYFALTDFMSHASDYALTLPEGKLAQYDLPRLLRETVEWDKKNAVIAEKARAKARTGKDSKYKEYPDGTYWTRLNEEGQFAAESDMMGHSVRGYERNPSLGGASDYGFNGWKGIQEEHAKVFSLRDADGISHVTVELFSPERAYGLSLDDKRAIINVQDLVSTDELTLSGAKTTKDFIVAAREGKYGPIIRGKIEQILADSKKNRGGYITAQVRGKGNSVPIEKYRAAIDDLIRQEADSKVEAGAGWEVQDPVKLARGEQSGFIHPDMLDMVAKGLVVTGGVALGVGLAPDDRKLAGGILGGLAGLLVPSGGTVASRMRQSGAMSLDGSRLVGMIFDGMSVAQEKALLDGARAKDSTSLRKLFETHSGRLRRSLGRDMQDVHASAGVDIDDIVQESFITAFEKIDNLRDGVQFYTWLYGIGKVKLRTAAKRGRLRRTESIEPSIVANDMAELGEPAARVEEHSPGHLDTPENIAMAQEMQEALNRSIKGMSDDLLKVFLLNEDGMPQPDIAAALGISPVNVRVRLSRAKAHMEASVQKYLGIKGGGRNSFVRDAGTEGRVGNIPKVPRNQQGAVDPQLLRIAMYVGAGAALGTYFRREDEPLYGAGLGMIAGFGLASPGGKRLFKGLDKAVGMVDYRIKKMSPLLWKKTKEHAIGELKGIDDGLHKVDPFLVLLNRLPQAHQAVVWQALSTSNGTVIGKVIEAAGGEDLLKAHKIFRAHMKERGDRLVSLGLIKTADEWHFPARVKDLEGLRTHLDVASRAFLDRVLDDAESKKMKSVGESLTEMEKNAIIRNVLIGFKHKGDRLPGFARKKVIPEITPELQPFYYSPTESVHSFIRESEKAVQKAKFFGVHRKVKNADGQLFTDTEESISSLTRMLREQGKLTDDEVFELAGMIRDRFAGGEQSMNTFLQGTKNLVSAGLLGNIYSAVTQIGDGIIQTGLQGPQASVLAAAKMLSRNTDINVKSIGITDYLAADFIGTDWTAKVARGSFKWGGFRAVDLGMKTFALQASFEKLKIQVRTQSGMKKLTEKYGEVFPKEEFDQLVKELKVGKRTDLIELVSFMELGRTQVMSMWDTPQLYQKHPTGRLFYHLALFNLRAANVFREAAFAKMASGNPMEIAKGLRNLLGLGLMYGIAGASTDKIKALLLGRDVEFDPMDVPLNTIEALGLNMYDYDKMQRSRDPIKELIWARGIPPTVKVIGGLATRPAEDSVRLLPVVGRPLHEFVIKDDE